MDAWTAGMMTRQQFAEAQRDEVINIALQWQQRAFDAEKSLNEALDKYAKARDANAKWAACGKEQDAYIKGLEEQIHKMSAFSQKIIAEKTALQAKVDELTKYIENNSQK